MKRTKPISPNLWREVRRDIVVGSILNFRIMIGAMLGMLLATAAATASGNSGVGTAPDIAKIVSSMVQAQEQNRAQHTAYEVVRTYRIFRPEETDPKSKVTALVSFLPPHLKTNKIEESTGGIVERVVRNALQHEVELTQNPTKSEYSPENYDFTLLGQETLQGNLCYVLGMQPKRESKDLLQGKAWVDAKTFLIRRVEGQPSKNLSWWIRDVHITLMYNNVNGMWLRTGSQASASVRFKGEMEFTSRDVDFRPVEDVAALHSTVALPQPTYIPEKANHAAHAARRHHLSVLPPREIGSSK
jgi:hypothetical protein